MARLAEIANCSIPYKPTSLKNILLETAHKHSDRTAVVALHQAADLYPAVSNGDDSAPHLRWTYSELVHGARLQAAALHDRGVRKGDPIASLLYNGADWALSFWAATLLGCPWVAIQPRTAANSEELAYILGISKPKVLLAWDAEQLSRLERSARMQVEAIPVKALCSTSSLLPVDWETLGHMLGPSLPAIDAAMDDPQAVADDTALILFTSGTTGLPKGCIHTHNSVTHMFRNHAQSLGLDETSSSVSHLTLAHCFGLLYSCSFWATGGKVVYSNAAFDAMSTLEALRLERCTHMPAVPSLMHALLEAVDEKTTHALRHIEFSGAMISRDIVEQARSRLGVSTVSSHYGMTESGPAALWPSSNISSPCANGFVSSGLPVPGAMLRVCAPESRKPLKRGEAGEIHQKSPHLIQGYVGGVPADQSYDDDYGRWMVTGDQGVMLESGEMKVCGRYRDIVIRGGENISPAQIEAVLSYGKDFKVQVVGAPDDLLGEVPVAVVQVAEPAANADFIENIQSLVVEKLGPTFAIDQVILLSDLGLAHFPQTSTGKVKKIDLATLVREYRKAPPRRDSGTEEETAPLSPKRIDTVDQLVRAVWAQILGIDQSDLHPESSIATMADSLTMMQARRLFRKQGMGITAPQLLEHPTIAAQTEFFSKPKVKQITVPTMDTRQDPPTAFDIAEAAGDETKAHAIQHCATPLLVKHGLSWEEDVEDVLPVADIIANMAAQKRRLRSAMRRDAFFAKGVDASTLANAVKIALGHHAPLRSMWFPTSATSVLQLVLRPTDRCLAHFVEISTETIDIPDNLATIWAGESDRDICASQKGPGALFRAVIFPIQTPPQSSGLVYWANHAAFDYTSLSYFHEALSETLALTHTPPTPRTAYKLFALAHQTGRTSALAHAGAAYLASRVHGLATYAAAATVPQPRAPCYFIGNDAGWLDPTTNLPGDPNRRKPLDGPSGTATATRGLTRTLHLPDLQSLQTTHHIPVHIVLKASLALANSLWTSHPRAFFRSLIAARSWPFVPAELAAHLPSAEDIAGPTLAASFEAFDFAAKPEESLGGFLRRLREEWEVARRYEHTPMGLAVAALRAGDRGALMEYGLSQLFNYLPHNPLDERGNRLTQVQDEMHADTGLHWDFSSLGGGRVRVHVRWDACQLFEREVEAMLGDLGRVAGWVAEGGNLGKGVGVVKGWEGGYRSPESRGLATEAAAGGSVKRGEVGVGEDVVLPAADGTEGDLEE